MGITYNFEGDTVGNEPAGWDDNSSAACSARVSNDVAHSGTKCVKFIDSNNNGWAYLDPEDLFNETEITLWFYMADTNKALGIYTYEDGPPSDILALVTFGNTGKITARDGAGTNDLQDYVKEQWYEIRITHDLGANTYDVWVDNVLKADNYAYVNGPAATFRSLRLITSKTLDTGLMGYVDDITIGPEESEELACGFEVGQGSRNLPAKFDAGQDSAELGAELEVGQGSLDLLGRFLLRHSDQGPLYTRLTVRHPGSQNLLGKFIVRHPASPQNLGAKFRVERPSYDLRGTAGIAFYWWGAANPPEALNQIILETPTGFWWSDFYDGPAQFRHVFIPWGSFTWVSAEQRYLEPHRHGLNEPDRSQIDGILFTIHTSGVRRIDYIYAPLMNEFKGKFIARHSDIVNLEPAAFIARHADSGDRLGKMIVRRSASQELGAGFLIRQETLDLPAAFHVPSGQADLPAKLMVPTMQTEDFEDATLVSHYQHDSGPGARSSSFARSGSWSWKTNQSTTDDFDISDGETLTYAKVTFWGRYGNGASNAIRFLNASKGILKVLWFNVEGAWTEHTLEHTGPIKYVQIQSGGGGNSGLWTDDIEITWAT